MSPDRPIGIAILAMGGQGGGVLADWLVALAESQGFTAQSTSVPGVAQRTGATLYYVEIIEPPPGKTPILSLMPVPGQVDIVIAAELLEAGRAIQRGLVTPDRTLLLASTHRALAMVEKIAPGNAIADPAPIIEAAKTAAHRFIAADFQSLAEQSASVISAALFGALSASAALPFSRTAFEATIRTAGIGAEASLRAFARGHAAVTTPPTPAAPPTPPSLTGGTPTEQAEYARALARLSAFPPETHDMLTHGLRRVTDYQDPAYAHEYLDHLAPIRALDTAPYPLTTEAARQVAVAMTYDDVIHVADRKTRPSRTTRLHAEHAISADLIETTEFLHPRVEELTASLPPRWGQAIERSPLLRRLLRRTLERPRRVRTTTIAGFLTLYLIAGLRPHRRTLLRHTRETEHLRAWLALVATHAGQNPALALELLKTRRLIKGYSDTHSRGTSKFDRVLSALPLLEHRQDAADWLRRLTDAALADAEGTMLDGALATIRTL